MVGFAEEIVFRGYLLVGARSRYSRGRRVVLPSALFGLFHGLNIITGQAVGRRSADRLRVRVRQRPLPRAAHQRAARRGHAHPRPLGLLDVHPGRTRGSCGRNATPFSDRQDQRTPRFTGNGDDRNRHHRSLPSPPSQARRRRDHSRLTPPQGAPAFHAKRERGFSRPRRDDAVAGRRAGCARSASGRCASVAREVGCRPRRPMRRRPPTTDATTTEPPARSRTGLALSVRPDAHAARGIDFLVTGPYIAGHKGPVECNRRGTRPVECDRRGNRVHKEHPPCQKQ